MRLSRKKRKLLTNLAFIFAGVGILAGCAVFVINALQQESYEPDPYGCYAPPEATHAFLFDSTTVNFVTDIQNESGIKTQENADTRRDIVDFIKVVYEDEMQAGDQFQLYAMEEKWTGVLPPAKLTFCKPPANKAELETILGRKHNLSDEYLAGQFEKDRSLETAQSEVKAIINNKAYPTMGSPILEMIQGVSRRFQNFEGDLTLHVMSDFLQNTEFGRFCQNPGSIPPFKQFKKKMFRRVKPKDVLKDATVRMYFREVPYGTDEFKCTRDELDTFWMDYWEAVGVLDIEVIPFHWHY